MELKIINKLLICTGLILSICILCYFTKNTINNDKLIEIAYNFIDYPYKINPIKCTSFEDVPDIKNFDCVTFVETALAIYKSKQNFLNTNFKKNIKHMRYKNSVNNCQNRNHFFIAEWMKNNPFFDFVNINHNIIKNKTIKKDITIDKSKWFYQKYNLYIKDVKLNLSMEYIRFDDFLKINKKQLKKLLPKISLLTIISSNPEIDINHVGFLINNTDEIVLLHASYKYKKIVEENIFKYVLDIKKNQKFQGISIFKITNKNNLHY